MKPSASALIVIFVPLLVTGLLRATHIMRRFIRNIYLKCHFAGGLPLHSSRFALAGGLGHLAPRFSADLSKSAVDRGRHRTIDQSCPPRLHGRRRFDGEFGKRKTCLCQSQRFPAVMKNAIIAARTSGSRSQRRGFHRPRALHRAWRPKEK